MSDATDEPRDPVPGAPGEPPGTGSEDLPTEPDGVPGPPGGEEPTVVSPEASARTQRLPATPAPPPPPAPPRRTGWWFALAALVIVVAGVVIGLVLADDGDGEATATSTTTLGAPTTTTSVASTTTAAATTTAAPTTAPVTVPAPLITSFTGPGTVSCTAPTDVELSWATTNASGVTIARDGTQVATGDPSGSQQVEFPCDGAVHTYVLVATNTQGATSQQALTITQA
jgi:hypothetical protein